MRIRADHPVVARLLEHGGSSVRSEDGQSLVELLMTMVILGIVLVVITGAFISGTKAETGVENRQQAQSDARVALSSMRDDIHCAFDVQSLAANASGGYTLSLTEFYNQCATVASYPGAGSTVYLGWCTIPDPLHAGTFDLYRASGACDNTGTRMAADIVSPGTGWPSNQPGNVWPVSRTCGSGYLKTQAVHLAVAPDSSAPNERYELKDEIALRNSTRSVGSAEPALWANSSSRRNQAAPCPMPPSRRHRS